VLAVSLRADDPDLLRGRLGLVRGRVSWVELRLDRAPDSLDLAALVADFPDLRFLATWIGEEDGGFGVGGAAVRRGWLERAAAAGVDAVDLPLGAEDDLPPGPRRVRSFHQAPGGPPPDWEATFERGRKELRRFGAPDGDVLKLVGRAEHAEEAAPLLDLLRRAPAGSLVAFAMGPGGVASRLLAPLLGAPWSYASWFGEATAPGQLDFRTQLALLAPAAPGAPLLGVAGDPVLHSASPPLWTAAMRAASRAGLYAWFPTRDLEGLLAGHQGLGAPLRALSVTAPLKGQAHELAVELDPLAAALGAVNFLVRDDDGPWRGRNTDGAGALDALEAAGLPGGASVLVVGAGGAARAAAAEALRRGHPVTVAARRPEAAAEAVSRIAAAFEIDVSPVAITAADLASVVPGDFDAVVQATPVGSHAVPGDPLAGAALRPGAFVLDMVYAPSETPLLRRAAAAGLRVVGGAEMLWRQLVVPFREVFGVAPDTAVLRTELEAVLHERSVGDAAALALVGPRAAGKTTLGRAAAAALDLDFVDADTELERRHGRRIAEWLPADPAGFRHAESALLRDLLRRRAAVVALGGGVVEAPVNRRLLAAHPRVVWLDASPADQLTRRSSGDRRPLLHEGGVAAEVEMLDRRRRPFYAEVARERVDVGGCEGVALERLLRLARKLATKSVPFSTTHL